MIGIFRYVDDVLAVSCCLCFSCLQGLVNSIYKDTVSFGDSCERSNFTKNGKLSWSVGFLDMFVCVSFSSVLILHKSRNELLLLGLGKRAQINHLPYTGHLRHMDFEQCVIQLRGRRNRWLQLLLDIASIRYTVLFIRCLRIFARFLSAEPYSSLLAGPSKTWD